MRGSCATCFFGMWISPCPSTFGEGQFCPHWYTCKKSVGCKYAGFSLGFQFSSTDLYVYPYVITILMWLLNLLGSFEIWKCDFSHFVLLEGFLGYSRSLEFPYKFLDQLVNFCRETSWDFDRDCSGSVLNFGSSAVLTILSVLIHECECLSCD